MTAMAKVRLLAVLTMDGCPAETTGLSGRWLGSDQYGIGALKEAATCVLTEDTSLTLLSNRMENTGDSLNYLIEATEKTAGIINGMIRMRLVDEIILYMVPVIAGNGSRLFQSSLPESEWTCTGSRQWKDGMVRIALRTENTPPAGGCVQEMNIFKSFRRSKCEHTFRFYIKNEASGKTPKNIFSKYYTEYQ